MELSQQGRLLQLLTGPLSTTEAVATRFVGSEGLSRPFRFVVDLLSTKSSVPATSVVGGKLSVMLFGHPIRQDVATVRLAHGIIARWTELGVVDPSPTSLTRYRAELVPWLSLLELSASTRTYEKKAVDAIVSDVFDRAGFKGQYAFAVTRTLEPRAYVVQYGESDLAFVSRLLEEEALYYGFEFHSDKHILTISDKHGRAIPEGVVASMPVTHVSNKSPLGSVPLIGPFVTPGSVPAKGARKGADKGVEELGSSIGAVVGTLLAPLGIGTLAGSLAGSGVGALADLVLDYLFTPDSIVLGNSVTEVRRELAVHTQIASTGDFHLLRPADLGVEVTSGPGSRGDYFEFLGDLSGTPESGVSSVEARRQMQRVEATRDIIRGATTNAALQPGTRVTVKGAMFGTAGTELHILEVGHAAESPDPRSEEGSKTIKYVNEFTAIPVDTQYAPPRTTARPSVRGTQTAQVVGAGGAGEIDVDEHGRILVMFPWDKGAGAAMKSQHRVHVASFWAGVGFGAVHWPRVGQLVLIEFLEGNMERPIVTGRVYSRQHPFPYAVPGKKTQSGVKSRSVGQSASDQNFNELRFEDKKGEEHVFLQAEKDLQVKVKASESRTVGGTRTANVEGNDTHEITKGNQVLHVKTGDQSFLVDAGNRTTTVSDDDKKTANFIGMEAKDQLEEKVGSSLFRMGGTGIHTEAGKVTTEGKQKIELTVGGSTITLEPTQIVLSIGPSKITMGPGGVKIDGVQIEVNGTATTKVTGAMTSVEGKAMTDIKGLMTQVNGSAMLTAKGAISMIG